MHVSHLARASVVAGHAVCPGCTFRAYILGVALVSLVPHLFSLVLTFPHSLAHDANSSKNFGSKGGCVEMHAHLTLSVRHIGQSLSLLASFRCRQISQGWVQGRVQVHQAQPNTTLGRKMNTSGTSWSRVVAACMEPASPEQTQHNEPAIHCKGFVLANSESATVRSSGQVPGID